MKLSAKIFFYLIIISFLSASCNSIETYDKSDKIKFIITGNTSPASPFIGFAERLPLVIEKINQENPVMVFHTGNIIHGGHDWMGINFKDINRQFKNFYSELSKLHSILYTIAGRNDSFNNSYDIYHTYTGKKINYSFNYGDIHFIILNTIDKNQDIIENKFKWLVNDLKAHKNFNKIFVFTHDPVFNQPYFGKNYKSCDRLHKILLQYHVKAVFSGNSTKFFEIKKDSISYVTTGCGGFTKEDRFRIYNQFYVVTINGNELTLEEKKINFPYNY